jgi:hypothetical protein
VTEAAKALAVTRATPSNLINGGRHLTRDGDPPRQGVRWQPGDLAQVAAQYDLAQALKREGSLKVK